MAHDRKLARQARYKKKVSTPEGRAAHVRETKAWRKANPEKARASSRRAQLKWKYGLTPAAYEALLNAQGGLCAICRRPQQTHRDGTTDDFAVDHDHVTDKVRGLLCHHCNTALGKMRDSPRLLRRAAAYLERARGDDAEVDQTTLPWDRKP